jgi:hypothetical protein
LPITVISICAVPDHAAGSGTADPGSKLVGALDRLDGSPVRSREVVDCGCGEAVEVGRADPPEVEVPEGGRAVEGAGSVGEDPSEPEPEGTSEGVAETTVPSEVTAARPSSPPAAGAVTRINR